MAFLSFEYFSDALSIQTTAHVLLPEPAALKRKAGQPVPTLYLLHGLSDDHTGWMRMTSLERYAHHYYLAVVMPAVNRSFYADMAHGAKYFTFVSRELPDVMERYFPLDRRRQGRFAAGLSMGGYGAMRLGLSLPERYAAVGSFSGPLELPEAYRVLAGKPDFLKELDNAFGGEAALRAGEGNLRNLAERIAPEVAPKIYLSCGTEDDLLAPNEHFVKHFGEKLDIHYRTVPGSHNWDVWDGEIKELLSWLPLEKLDGVW